MTRSGCIYLIHQHVSETNLLITSCSAFWSKGTSSHLHGFSYADKYFTNFSWKANDILTMLSLKLSYQSELWLLSWAIKYMSFNTINLCLIFSGTIISDPQEITVTWASKSLKWVLRNSVCTRSSGQGNSHILYVS